MQEWCLQHPWMTFFLAFFCIESVSVVLQRAIDARRRPTKTAIFQGTLKRSAKNSDTDTDIAVMRNNLN